MINKDENKLRGVNPREKANFLSKVTFYYMLPIFKKWKVGIEEKDVYEVTSSLESDKQGGKLERKWNVEQKQLKPSIKRTLLSTYGFEFFFLGSFQLVNRLMVIWFQPYFLGKFVSYFTPHQTEIKLSNAYFYAFSLVLLNLTSCVINHTYMQYILEFTVKVKSGMSSLIYRKASKLSHKSLSEIGVGKIVTLITKDVATFDTALQLINDVWIGIAQTIFVSILIYRRVGFAAIVGVGALISVIPFQLFLGKSVIRIRNDSAKYTDERLKYTQETLSAIKVIKMYTWELFFENKINESRRSEIKKLAKIYFLKASTIIFGMLSLKLSFFVLIITYIMRGNILSAELIYFIYTAFNELRKNISMAIPLGISQAAELYTSLNRIQTFLVVTEKNKFPYNDKRPIKIYLKNVSATLDLILDGNKDNLNLLNDVSLEVEDKNTLVVISGPTGSGKSSILKVILHELENTSGVVDINGRISYAPQHPWVFPGTIKDNIIFGESIDLKRYKDVLRICALNHDLNQFTHGDDTIVADEGVNLSKGQLARINLARAVYKNSDIYLLDDCLAAVDKKINRYIFEKCIRSFLGDKIVIMISNDVSHIRSANKHLTIEDGKTLSLEEQAKDLQHRVSKFIDDDLVRSKEVLDSFEGEETIEEDKETKVKDESIKFEKSENQKDDSQSVMLETIILNKDEEVPLLTQSNKDIYSEDNEIGNISIKAYKSYLKFCGGLFLVVSMMILFVMAQVWDSYSEKMLGDWVTKEQTLMNFILTNMTNKTDSNNQSITNANDDPDVVDDPHETTKMFNIIKAERNLAFKLYSVMILFTSVLLLLRFFAFFALTARASKTLHKKMISSVIYTEMLFFNTHYLGNVLNRFSKDLATIDEYIPFLLFENFALFLYVVGMFALLAYVQIAFLVPATLVIGVFYWLRRIYLPVGRCLRRLEASTRSPMIGTLNSTLEGLLVIRATNSEKRLMRIFDNYQNHYISANFMAICTTRAFGFYLDVICNLYSAIVIFYLLQFSRKSDPGTVGLAVSSSFAIVGLLQWAIRQWAELETNMTSMERVLQYTDFKSEFVKDQDNLKPEKWPSEGAIEFKDVHLTINGNTALSGLNCKIPAKKTISIVGRTGAGKSSFVGVLFKLYDFEGEVLIDGENIKEVNRKYLRQKIAVIPQNPLLFSGSIRSNLDPFKEYKDEDLWRILEQVKLKDKVKELDDEISLMTFSTGQRQLLNLARAITEEKKILVLDEATANMDEGLDDQLHEIIKEVFKDSTILIITHRLKYVTDSDLVILMKDGKIDLIGDPKELEKEKEFANFLKGLDK